MLKGRCWGMVLAARKPACYPGECTARGSVRAGRSLPMPREGGTDRGARH